MRAEPDSFVVLFPVSWSTDNLEALRQVHGGQWQEKTQWSLEPVDDGPEGVEAAGEVTGPDDKSADLVVEGAIEKITGAAGTAKEQLTASELSMLENHEAVWRVTVEGGLEEGLERAVWMTQLMNTFCEAGAAGAFLPACLQLHSPSFVQNQAMGIGHIQPMVNLFVSAWDQDDWMMTRGLTAFGLPELETPVDEGLNASYFRLMDAAAGMLNQRDTYPLGADLQIGHESFEIEEGRQGPDDEKVPIAGHFGVLSVVSK